MNPALKAYIQRIFPEGACIKKTLEELSGLDREAKRNGLVVSLMQSGVSGEEVRRILSVPEDVPDFGLIGGWDWVPGRPLTISELFDDVDQLLGS